MDYIFTLKYQLPPHEQDMDALIGRLGEAGCDDALIGIGQPGRLALAFTREAACAEDAINSALADVRQALPTATLIEATPDLVGLTDAAELMGMSRQNMRKLMLANAATFPPPIHEGSASIWHLAEILAWMQTRGSYALKQNLMDISQMAMRVNVAKEQTRLAGPAKVEPGVLAW
ncbi:helix-turn-helix transcriptional regulator [Pseudomonas turukhanskensis]|nr:DNA-binding protein [Pseudomonas turukhanskensis]